MRAKLLRESRPSSDNLPSRKQRLPVEDHYDDCGDSLAGLRPEQGTHWAAPTAHMFRVEESGWLTDEELRGVWEDLPEFFDGHHFLHHLHALEDEPWIDRHGSQFESMAQLVAFLAVSEPGTDVCEVFGGAGRTTAVCIRRHFRGGKNWDLTCGVDLSDPTDVRALWDYFEQGVWVVILQPPCTAFGAW